MLVSHASFRAAGDVEPAAMPRVSALPSVETCALDSVPSAWHAPWDALAVGAAEPNVFAERWYMNAAARHLPPPGGGRLLSVWAEGAMIGLLPIRIDRRYGRIRVAHVENWRTHHTFLGTPLVKAGQESAFWTALLGALDEADWAPNFLHLTSIGEDGPVHRGLRDAATRLGRPCDSVYRTERAMLASSLSPAAYYEEAVRKKKRKELKRLSARLDELGAVAFEIMGSDDNAERWCADFLALEASGWKGRQGTALAQDPATELFFREIFASAHVSGRLEARRLTLDGKPIAMLINLLAAPGAFSFKIAIDEDYARFSPGVLIQIENLNMLDRDEIEWTDSCAVEDHAMINSLWRERRALVRLSVPFSGTRRRAIFAAARLLEKGSALLRRLTGVKA